MSDLKIDVKNRMKIYMDDIEENKLIFTLTCLISFLNLHSVKNSSDSGYAALKPRYQVKTSMQNNSHFDYYIKGNKKSYNRNYNNRIVP